MTMTRDEQRDRLRRVDLRKQLAAERPPTHCEYCGRAASDPHCGKLTMDHITAKSRLGSDTVNNLAWACEPCNKHKDYLSIAEWLGEGLQQAMAAIRPLCVTEFPDGSRKVVSQPDYKQCSQALAEAGLPCGRAVTWYALRRIRANAKIANRKVRHRALAALDHARERGGGKGGSNAPA